MQGSGTDTDLQRKVVKDFHSHSPLIKVMDQEFGQCQNSTEIGDSFLIPN